MHVFLFDNHAFFNVDLLTLKDKIYEPSQQLIFIHMDFV